MTDLQLYKFIKENEVEIDWRGDELVIWLHPYDIKDFVELVGDNYITDGEVRGMIVSCGYIAIDIAPICEDFDIEPTDIQKKEN